MAVSIKDVARVAEVSYSTVSRALNNSPRVNPQTKDRIRQAAAELGYLPSAVARSLVTRRTHTLGVIVTTITDLFFAEVIRAIEETALADGYSVILATSAGDARREVAALRVLRERRVDGLILISSCSSPQDLAAEKVDIPLIIVNSYYREHLGLSVEVDNVAGSRMATEHLLALGHRRIAHISGPLSEWDAMERQSGYEQALAGQRMPVSPALIVRGDNRPEGGIRAMWQLLALEAPPTAVFCYNDATALGAMRAARAAGLRVPQDLSVVGFDDIDLAAFFEPPLTTVAQPKREMGERAVQMVFRLLAGEPDVGNSMLPSRLVVRESTATARG